MTNFIEGIVLKKWALSDYEEKWMRQKLRFTHTIGNKGVKEVFHKLVKIVEKNITKELLEVGIISELHDEWTKGGVHYIGLVACYNQFHNMVLKGKTVLNQMPVLRLLERTPLPGIPDNSELSLEDLSEEEREDYLEENHSFTTVVHMHFVKIRFDEIYHIDNDKLKTILVNQTDDSTPVDIKLATELSIPTLNTITIHFTTKLNK